MVACDNPHCDHRYHDRKGVAAPCCGGTTFHLTYQTDAGSVEVACAKCDHTLFNIAVADGRNLTVN